MAFTQADLLNQLSRVFTSRVADVREGSVVDPTVSYQQVVDLLSLTILMQPRSIFHIAKLASNRLHALVRQEAAVLEDMLVLLANLQFAIRNSATDLSQSGLTELADARTAILELGFAEAVRGRPELNRALRKLDEFLATLRPNVVTPQGTLGFPRGEARKGLSLNLLRLQVLHREVVAHLAPLRDLIEELRKLDIPTKAARTAFGNIQKDLQEMIDAIRGRGDEDNIAQSRQYLLQALTNRVALATTENFIEPNPDESLVASGSGLTAKVVGEGTAATVVSAAGPWPLDSALLNIRTVSVEVDGGAVQTVDFSDVIGAAIEGRNKTPFNFSPPAVTVPPVEPSEIKKRNRLHLVVDSQSYEFTVSTWRSAAGSVLPTPTAGLGAEQAVLTPRATLGFKHLGCPFTVVDFSLFTFADVAKGPQTDAHPRIIVELENLKTVTLTHAVGDEYTAPAGTFETWYIGFYIKKANARYEITEVFSDTRAAIDVRADALGSAAGSVSIFGQNNATSIIQFWPPLPDPALSGQQITAAGSKVTVGAAVKTVQFSESSQTDAQVVAAINVEVDPTTDLRPYTQTGFAVKARARDGKVIIEARSRLRIELAIAPAFYEAKRASPPSTVPQKAAILAESGHEILGFGLGQGVDPGVDPFLTAQELKAKLEAGFIGVTVETVRDVLREGVLSTTAGSKTVTDATVNFTTLGIVAGVQLEIQSGDAAGDFVISSVSGSNLVLYRGSNFKSAEIGLPYRLVRDRVRLTSKKKGFGSSLKVTGQPTAFAFPSSIQYGLLPEIVVVDVATGKQKNFTKEGVRAGDSVAVDGQTRTVSSVAASGLSLILDAGLRANLENAPFAVDGLAESSFRTLRNNLKTFTTSESLLRKHGFERSVADIDAAFTTVLSPGASLLASTNQARDLVLYLLSILTGQLRRSVEHGYTLPAASMRLDEVLLAYKAPDVAALTDVLDAMHERRFDRAADFVVGARLKEFYALTQQTASYSGSVLRTSQIVIDATPRQSSAQADVEAATDTATSTQVVEGAEEGGVP